MWVRIAKSRQGMPTVCSCPLCTRKSAILASLNGLNTPAAGPGAELAGIYSARLGCVLYEVDDARHVVIVLDIRHRSAACRRRRPCPFHARWTQL
jgi:hypothetical protein